MDIIEYRIRDKDDFGGFMTTEIMETKDSPPGEPTPSSREKSGWNKPKPATIPRPTYWPLVLAFGIVLILFGIVTSWIASGVGAIFFAVGLGGWIGELRRE
jgi:hypothetical protein